MIVKLRGVLIVFTGGIFIAASCQSIPQKIDNRKLAALSDQESRNLQDLEKRVVDAKHRKDSQRKEEAIEIDRMTGIENAMKPLTVESEKKAKQTELDAAGKRVAIEKKKSTVARLELSCSIAALERQKARIATAQSKLARNTEAYEAASEKFEKELAAEKAELLKLEQEKIP